MSEKIVGCVIKIENGFVVEECNGKIRKICVPGTRTKNGGFSIFGSGGNGGYGHPDLECFRMSKINEKLRKAEK